METSGIMGFIYKLTDWIMRLAYVNIPWIVFSIAGLVLLGFFPATIAMFSVIRLSAKNEDVPIFKTFWNTYKQEFLKSNLLGLIVIITAFILYIDLQFLKETTNTILQQLYLPLIFLSCLFYLTVLYMFPIFVQYDLKIVQIIKNAFLIMIMNPLPTLYMISGIIAVYFAISYLPGLLPVFSGSILSLIIMSCATLAFKKIERKKSELEVQG
jgi:uncharacterized membrane protein YesL